MTFSAQSEALDWKKEDTLCSSGYTWFVTTLDFGFVAGLNFKIQEDWRSGIQNAYYNGWNSAALCSEIPVFASDGCVIYKFVNTPESWQDSKIAVIWMGLSAWLLALLSL